MLRTKIVSVVNICASHGWPIVVIAAILAVLCGYYTAVNFSIDTNVNKLISSNLDWRKNELTLDAAFPYRHEIIVAVVEAPTSELASQATAALVAALSQKKDIFHSVSEPAGGPFFEKNGLLFLPTQEVVETTKRLGESKPIVQALAQDRSLRGLTAALNYGLVGVRVKNSRSMRLPEH